MCQSTAKQQATTRQEAPSKNVLPRQHCKPSWQLRLSGFTTRLSCAVICRCSCGLKSGIGEFEDHLPFQLEDGETKLSRLWLEMPLIKLQASPDPCRCCVNTTQGKYVCLSASCETSLVVASSLANFPPNASKCHTLLSDSKHATPLAWFQCGSKTPG